MLTAQLAFTFSKSTMESSEQCVKSVQALKSFGSKLTTKTPEHVTDIVLRSLVTFTHCSGVSFIDFEQVNTDWETICHKDREINCV